MEEKCDWKLELDPGEEIDDENMFLYRFIVQTFTNDGLIDRHCVTYSFAFEETAIYWARQLADRNVRCSVYRELATTVNRA